jgi:hypothetical protein
MIELAVLGARQAALALMAMRRSTQLEWAGASQN